jgi:hypothetical protein
MTGFQGEESYKGVGVILQTHLGLTRIEWLDLQGVAVLVTFSSGTGRGGLALLLQRGVRVTVNAVMRA